MRRLWRRRPGKHARGRTRRRTTGRTVIGAILALSVLLSTPVGAQVALRCSYTAVGPEAELEPRGECATVRDGRISILPEHLGRILFHEDGLATILIGSQWHYLDRAGELLPVIPHDNGADSFTDGLVRSLVGGKIAFYDKSFNQAIGPRYDWAWPFSGGRALVCVGCRAGPPDGDGHRGLSGGKWGFIDRSGVEIVPVLLTREEAAGLE